MRLLLLLLVAAAQGETPACREDLVEHWNKFVTDANAYVHTLDGGVLDAHARQRVMREWVDVTRCECW
jgi:hypothetical protein